MKDTNQIIEDVDSLKALLEDAAQTKTNMNGQLYRSLKTKLFEIPRVQDLLPTFLRSRSTLTSFRSYSQQFPTYAERRAFIEKEFEPVLTYLYQEMKNPTGVSKRQNTEITEDPIEANSLLLLSIMVEQNRQSASNSELQSLSEIEDGYDVNDALERLEEKGAVEVTWIRSTSSLSR